MIVGKCRARAVVSHLGPALDGALAAASVSVPVTSPFVPGPAVRIAGAPTGPLAGLTFAAKDLFDVAGHPTGGGNPDWARQHPIPTRHAWAVQRLLDAGATLIGKTITDEVSLGILGENPFDGTPLNPRAPDRVPGGSSSGSASAVAQGLCDTALGTDTGGSVRVPASFCGLHGIRPTHGRLDLTGMLPQAPSSDTTGWFARDAQTFARVSEVLLGEPIPPARPARLVVAQDAFGLADEETATALRPMVRRLGALVEHVREDVMAPPGLTAWARAQRTLQPWEAWLTFKEWIDRDNPRMQWSVARNLVLGSVIPESERQWAALVRAEARARLAALVPPGTILCLPTTPFPAPLKGLPLATLEPLRARITCLAAHGGLAGLPQVSLPGALVGGLPVGLSILGCRGSDAMLVAVAKAMEAAR
jgi:amidase